MKKQESTPVRILFTILRVIVGGVGVCYLLLILLLFVVKMMEPDRMEVTLSDSSISLSASPISEVYLRNQTTSDVSLTLTVPRSSLQLDTVWWGVQIAPEAIGRAVIARRLSWGWTEYPVGAPIYLQGSGDTLVADKPIDLPATGLAGKRKRFYPDRNLPLWKERLRQFKPDFEPTVRLRPYKGEPDSAVVEIRIAPSGTFFLAWKETRPAAGANDLYEGRRKNAKPVDEVTEKMFSHVLLPKVQWVDSLHQHHNHYITLTDIKKAQATKPAVDSTKPGKSIHYLDY